jgi:hypothetical protein
MSQLQQLLPDVSPVDFLVIAYVLGTNIWRYVKSRRDRRARDASASASKPEGRLERLLGLPPEGRYERLMGLLLDTVEAIVIILCIWIVGWFLERTLGPGRTMGGIPLTGLLDCAHFAVVFDWLVKGFMRLLP